MLDEFVPLPLIWLSWNFAMGESGWFLNSSSTLVFFGNSIWLHFFIFYEILPYYVYYYCTLIRIVKAIGTSFFFCAHFYSFHTHFSLLTSFCFFVLFQSSCSHAQVFDKTFMNEFPILYRHTEWCLHFFAKRDDRNGPTVACQKLTIIIIIIETLHTWVFPMTLHNRPLWKKHSLQANMFRCS